MNMIHSEFDKWEFKFIEDADGRASSFFFQRSSSFVETRFIGSLQKERYSDGRKPKAAVEHFAIRRVLHYL